MENINLTLNLTVSQVNTILKYLGNGAFIEVESIINAIRAQAAPQLSDAQGNEPQVFTEETSN